MDFDNFQSVFDNAKLSNRNVSTLQKLRATNFSLFRKPEKSENNEVKNMA